MLYEFLVPYRRYSLAALEKAVLTYIQKPESYLSALTGAVGDPATLFSAVRCFLLHLPVLWMHLMRNGMDTALTVSAIRQEVRSPNGRKCRSEEKRRRMNWAAKALRLSPDLFTVGSRAGYPVFSNGRGCPLLRTHTSECLLF